MMWMRMPGQSWPGAALSFLGMWMVMMAAMMSPSFVPMLWRYRQALAGAGETRPGWQITLVSAGYFLVWSGFGMSAFVLGAVWTSLEMRLPTLAQAAPLAAGTIVLIAGALQFTAWKAHHLACCREASVCGCGPGDAGVAWDAGAAWEAGAAWRQGLRLGLHCCCCCAGLTTIQLVAGVMDLRVMAGVAAAIGIERLAPAARRMERAIGVLVVVLGLFLIGRSAGLG